jgi:hypothetical protein
VLLQQTPPFPILLGSQPPAPEYHHLHVRVRRSLDDRAIPTASCARSEDCSSALASQSSHGCSAPFALAYSVDWCDPLDIESLFRSWEEHSAQDPRVSAGVHFMIRSCILWASKIEVAYMPPRWIPLCC